MICKVMPRGHMSKVDILARVYKMKNELYNGQHKNKGKDWHDGAQESLNKILEMLNEYSY